METTKVPSSWHQILSKKSVLNIWIYAITSFAKWLRKERLFSIILKETKTPLICCYGSMDRSDRNGFLESKLQQDDGCNFLELSRSVQT